MSIISRLRGDVEAARWARENGGVWALKDRVFALNGFLFDVEKALGIGPFSYPFDVSPESEVARTLKRLKERLADPNIAWPRFEDGQPVLIGSLALSRDQVIEVGEIGLCEDVFTLRGKTQDKRRLDACFVYAKGERVKRPDPHPTGMDGKPIEVGEFVWATWQFMENEAVKVNGTMQTRSKVVDKWIKYRVLEILPDGKCRLLDVEVPTSETILKPEKLTHSEPDTWEKLERDSDESPFNYCRKVGHHLDTFEDAEEFKSKDLLRRAMELVKRERSERDAR